MTREKMTLKVSLTILAFVSAIIFLASYLGINHKKILYSINQPEKNKFSIEKLEKLHYDDVKNLDENFNPQDLIEENDEEDNIYLAEYNLDLDKQLREHNKNQEVKRLQ